MGLGNFLGGSLSSDRPTRGKGNSTTPSTSSLNSTSSTTTSIGNEYISDEVQLRPVEDEEPDLRELNACLEALAAVFPDVQVDVFREMLVHFDGESRLAVVADTLLKNRATWVKGRWRVPVTVRDGGGSREAGEGLEANKDHHDAYAGGLRRNEVFRSESYKKAVETLAWHEFKGLSRPTVNAVLAEFNYSYLDARQTLVDLSSRSWRFAISTLFSRRKPPASAGTDAHPLVIWRSSGQGSIVPCLKSTGNAELDRELFTELIMPLLKRARMNQEAKDRAMALALNNEEAEQSESMFECGCCFTESSFEELTSCTGVEGHLICFRCVQHSVTEAVFGQSWQQGIDKETGTLRCPALDSEGCKGCIPHYHMQRAMLEEKNGAGILHKLEQRLADHSIVGSDLPLVCCPFCSYAEIDDIYMPASESHMGIRANNLYNLAFVVLLLCAIVPFAVPVLLFSWFVALMALSSSPQRQSLGAYYMTQFRAAVVRQRRRRRGLKFTCQNAGECGRSSCLSCGKEWVDVHVCNESSLVALRTQVEQAMSLAIKRVCPRCNTSFVKTAGCNKLTCPCGYKMCYVCRKDIGGTGDGPDVGYRHFCDHFRPEGDPKQCTECNRCNLWESENTEVVLQQAKEEAERKWRETEKRELSGAEKAFLETGLALKTGSGGAIIEKALRKGRLPTVAEFFDFVVENLYV